MNRTHNHFDTLVGHADHGLDEDSSLSAPIHQTATFRADSAEAFWGMADTPRHPRYYTRFGNPTFQRAERIVATLEGADAALLVASGMAAISSTVLALVAQGDHVIAQKTHYMGTSALLATLLPKFGVAVTLVDQIDTPAFANALQPTTKLIVVETPSNPLLRLTDLSAISELAQNRGVTTLCDSTIATPINQTPLKQGIDLVIHSATKFLGGHHDLMAGVIAGSAHLLEKIWHAHVVLGAVPDPFAAWLLLRGLRTLPLRIERQNRTALEVAQFLERHTTVRAVHYPGLESHPQYPLARRQMSGGCGGLLSFELKGGLAAANRFQAAMTLPGRAVSFGGFCSLATHPAGMWAGSIGAAKAAEAGIDPSLIRLSVGLEHRDDLVADLDQALERSAAPETE